MRTVLLCATKRGLVFLKKPATLRTKDEPVVFSFREEPWEPAYLDDIRGISLDIGGQFFEGRQVGSERYAGFWQSTLVDLMLAVNWRYLIPPSLYARPRLGTYVFHDSLLPEYRGFSPTVWAIMNGEDHTGVTLFRIADEVDAGDVVDQERVPIGKDDTIATVTDRVTETYLALLERNQNGLMSGQRTCHSQDHSRATYACKLMPDDCRINWAQRSARIYNLIRAVGAPYPGAFSYLSGKRLRIWAAETPVDYRPYVGHIPGRVVEIIPGKGSVVLTGDGVLLLTVVQVDGQDATCAADVLNSITQTLGF